MLMSVQYRKPSLYRSPLGAFRVSTSVIFFGSVEP